MKKLRVSVIGTGHLGSIHARLWSVNPNIDFAGIYDIAEEKSRQIAKELHCYEFSSFSELIEKSDAVTISTPTSTHFDIATECIKQGIHCLVEKPITSTYEESKTLIKQASSNKLIVQVGHVERFNPALAAMHNYNLEPLFIETHRLSQFKPRAIDVSVVHDLMIHDIDIILWLVKSQVQKVDANGVAILTDTPDIANARITFCNGAVANLTASRITARPMRKMRIFQKNAYFSIDFAKQDVEVFRLDDDLKGSAKGSVPATMLGSIDLGIHNRKILFEKPAIPQINAIDEEQKAFVNSILGNKPVAVSAGEASEALRIAEEISLMIEQNKPNLK